jgi:hypothetical protein
MATWRLQINDGISLAEIETMLKKEDFTQQDVFDLLDAHGCFKPSPEYGVFKKYKNWKLFSAYAMSHLEHIKITRTNLYNQHVDHAIDVFHSVCKVVTDEILSWGYPVVFYGTNAMKTFSHQYGTSWASISSDMTTIDIDVSVDDPKSFSSRVFDFLVNYAKNMVMANNMLITAVYLSDKDAEIYSVSMDVRIKQGNHYYLCKYDNILDCSHKSIWTDNTYFNVAPNTWCQTPLHYVCGIVDKLYNVVINNRISGGVKTKAILEAKDKITKMNIGTTGWNNPRTGIDDFVLNRSSSQLTTFKNTKSKDYACRSAIALLQGDKMSSLDTYDRWLESYKT